MSKLWKINNELLEFEEIFYVDNVNGQDYNDGLTPATAFKTIKKYAEQTVENSACIVIGTDYTWAVNDFTNKTNYTRTYISLDGSTVFKNTSNATIKLWNDARTQPTKFIRFTFQNTGTISANNGLIGFPQAQNMVEFHNCFFNVSDAVPSIVGTYNTVSDLPSGLHFFNCSFTRRLWSEAGRRPPANSCSLTNCTVSESAISLSNSSVITTTLVSLVDITTFNPLLDPSYWEFQGTGENPDRSQANIGLNGGPFAWGRWKKGEPLILIDVEDEILGVINTPPQISYRVKCANNLSFNMNAVETINAERIRNINNVIQDKEYVLTLDNLRFYQLDNRMNDLSVTIDAGFEMQTRHFIFSRIVDKIDVITKPLVNTYRMSKITVELQYDAPSENVKIYVSNNALDDEPTWESAENMIEHVFSNNNKIHKNWAVATRVYIERDDINDKDVSLSEIKYTYE